MPQRSVFSEGEFQGSLLDCLDVLGRCQCQLLYPYDEHETTTNEDIGYHRPADSRILIPDLVCTTSLWSQQSAAMLPQNLGVYKTLTVPRRLRRWLSTPADRPLAGIKIIDFTRVLAGPFATMMLVSSQTRILSFALADHRRLIWEVRRSMLEMY